MESQIFRSLKDPPVHRWSKCPPEGSASLLCARALTVRPSAQLFYIGFWDMSKGEGRYLSSMAAFVGLHVLQNILLVSAAPSAAAC